MFLSFFDGVSNVPAPSVGIPCRANPGWFCPQVKIENLEMEVKTLSKKLETKQKQASLDQHAFPIMGSRWQQYELRFLAVFSKGTDSKDQEVSTGRSHQDMALNYLEFIFPRKG
jgi:hypothetical protein